jgi:hypothetical protein
MSTEFFPGPPPDIAKITALAESGDPVAQYQLGLLYHIGHGVPMSYRESLDWYRKSANQGNPEAQNALGMMYYVGHGVPKDYVQVYKWLKLAADQGVPSAAEKLESFKIMLTPAQIEEGKRLVEVFRNQ